MCKPKIKELKRFKGIIGITLAPFGIFIRKDYMTNPAVINHESIHWRQQLEMGILPFYIWYGLEWLIKWFQYGSQAYMVLSFEQEAYRNEDNMDYLKTRKTYSWIHYIRTKRV